MDQADQIIVAVKDGNWHPQDGTVLGKTSCSLDVTWNGTPVNVYFYTFEGTPDQMNALQSDSQILGTIPLGSALGAHGRASRAGTQL